MNKKSKEGYDNLSICCGAEIINNECSECGEPAKQEEEHFV